MKEILAMFLRSDTYAKMLGWFLHWMINILLQGITFFLAWNIENFKDFGENNYIWRLNFI